LSTQATKKITVLLCSSRIYEYGLHAKQNQYKIDDDDDDDNLKLKA
jgi:hypothetical protein